MDDLYATGTVARIVKVIKLGASNYSVLLQGIARMELVGAERGAVPPRARAAAHREPRRTPEIEKLSRELRELARALGEYSPPVPRELGPVAENAADPGALADLVTLHLPSPPVTPATGSRCSRPWTSRSGCVSRITSRGASRGHRVRKEIQGIVSGEMGRSEREEILRAQLKTIKEELGETDESEEELDQLRERIAKAQAPARRSSAWRGGSSGGSARCRGTRRSTR
jgi:ATP-dependent Lon protease